MKIVWYSNFSVYSYVLLEPAKLTHLCIVYGCFPTKTTELTSCDWKQYGPQL